MPTPMQGDAHIDVPLSNMAVSAFADQQQYIAQQLFPVVNVAKESDIYYKVDKDAWLRNHNTLRARKAAPNAIEFQVSSDGYRAKNYALREDNALEDLANADAALRLREQSVNNIVEALLRDYELRVANMVTSISNVGSGVILSGASKWSAVNSSNPISDVTTAHAFIRQHTGLTANTMVVDYDTLQILRTHPDILSMFQYTSGGLATDQQLREVFQVDRILVGRAIYNSANEGATASIGNIWGNNVVIAHVEPGLSLKTKTLGLSMRWTPAGIPRPFQVTRYQDADPGKKVEWVEAGYYQDEKIIAPELGYVIASTL